MFEGILDFRLKKYSVRNVDVGYLSKNIGFPKVYMMFKEYLDFSAKHTDVSKKYLFFWRKALITFPMEYVVFLRK